MEFLGTKVLEELYSPINGKIRVIRTLGLGTYIQAENVTQSGGVVYEVWKIALKKLKGRKKVVKNCLLLGLGGGSAATLVRKYWEDAEITGVDIDPIMVELGKKYLKLPQVRIVINDAYLFLEKKRKKFDLVLVDTYSGDKYPEEFEKEKFIALVKSSLSQGGIAIFNRLYYREKRPEAVRFGERLEKVFPRVERIFPEANIMFIAS
ncbi:MAG: spermidine synthase [Patescibacteria group bacterium]